MNGSTPGGGGLSLVDARGYNTDRSTSLRPWICRSNGYWTIERCLLVIDYSMLRGALSGLGLNSWAA